MGLRVLHVSHPLSAVSADAAGGAEQVLATLHHGLLRAGHASAVVAPAGSRLRGRLFRSPPVAPPYDAAAKEAAVVGQAAAVRAALASGEFDLVHLHGQHLDAVLPQVRPPALATLHLPPAWYPRGTLARRPGLSLACVSESEARALPAGAPAVAVVPNGVPLEVFRPAGERRAFALVIARICPEKGIHLALDAARRSGTPLLLAGQTFPYPEHLRYFREEVRPRLGAGARFLGPLGLAAKVRLLSAARCLVVPSLAPETSSLVAMEALACGTPVVAQRVGALPEIVEDGRTGFLVDSVEGLAAAIRDAARLSPAECRRAAEDRFGAGPMVERYLDLYRRLLRRRRTRAGRPARPARVRAPSRVEEVSGFDALAALRGAWSDLADRAPAATPFQRPEWLLPYCRAFGVAEPWAVLLRRGGRLAAIAPLVIFRDGPTRIATLLGAGRSDWQDALVDPALAPDGAAVLLARIAARAARYDALLLERLPAGSGLRRGLPSGLLTEVEEPDEPCPALRLPSDPARLVDVAAPRVLESARTGWRRLARGGDVAVRPVGPGALDGYLDALFALHGARWARRGEPGGVLADPRVRWFHRLAARGLLERGVLRAFLLLVDGRPVGALHGFLDHGRAYHYLLGFEPDHRAASPGTILIAHLAEQAIREGARELDLLRGREPYKYAWGASDQPAFRRVLGVAGGVLRATERSRAVP